MKNKNYASILILSDEAVPAYYRDYSPKAFEGIDLIISCGDLSARYLSFIADVFSGDVLYVPGNHDEDYLSNPPLGCIDIDGKLFVWKGLRILGLGGSMRYKEGPFQYTDAQMRARVRRLWLSLRRHGGIDILVTHAPARGLHDQKDPCHQGFTVFIELLEKYHPSYFFHGHVHLNYGDHPRCSTFEQTTVINGFERFVVQVPLPHPNEDPH